MKKRRLLAAFLLLAPSGLALGQAVPIGPEFQVNTYTTNYQYRPSVAVDGSGIFVVVWQSFGQDGSEGGIFGRWFDGGGAPLGGEFQVNTVTMGNQARPSIAVDGSGNFVVTWNSYGQDGSGYGVFGRRFDSGGAPLGGEFQINAYTTSSQFDSSVAMDGSGNFVVVWESFGQDGAGGSVFSRRFDRSGVPLGGDFQVNTYTTSDQRYPSVAIDGLGGFVVVWTSTSQDGFGRGVFGRRFNNAGVPLGGEFPVNTFTASHEFDPHVAVDGSGSFVVVWTNYGQDGEAYGVSGRRFDSAGAPLAGEFQVNTYATGFQYYPSVALDGSGNFVVVWNSFPQDGSGPGVFGQQFDSTGTPLGGEFQVNTYTTNYQFAPSVAVNRSGNFVVAWNSLAQDGSDYGVFGQRFSCSDLDDDGLCDAEEIVVTSPLDGDTLDCSNPAVIRPAISWSAGNYQKFRVYISSNSGFTTGTTVTSGSGYFTNTVYTPPLKKWKSACKKAVAANPSAPELFFKVFGVDLDVPKNDVNRKTYSQTVRADVTP